MSLKAGRVGVNPKDVNPIDGSIIQSSDAYTKAEADAKFGSIHVFKTEGTANVTTWATAMNALITEAGGSDKLAELLEGAIATLTVILKNVGTGAIISKNVFNMAGMSVFTNHGLTDDGETPAVEATLDQVIFNFNTVKRLYSKLTFTLATGAVEYTDNDTSSSKISSNRGSELILTIVKKEED